MKLYNSLSNSLEEFKPLKKGEVSMYTCGPTVYNYAHIWNFFAYLSADTLFRWLKYGERYNVKWVMNITDIDDKTIRDSKAEYPELEPKQALKKLCDFYSEAFEKDLETLSISRNSFLDFPKATDYIEEQKGLVEKLIKNWYAYISEGSVYFDINSYKKDHDYGRLVKIDEWFKNGVKVDNDEYEKASAADFVLWKAKKDWEPFWDFEFEGQDISWRPGWHLECSAMEKELLGLPFDIHTWGLDLKFPHHENEMAQSLWGYGIDPTKYWVHNWFLKVEWEKMSKSKGNFYRLSDLIEKGLEVDSIRFHMVTNHYRKNFNFTQQGLDTAKKHLNEIRSVYELLVNKEETKPETETVETETSQTIQLFVKDIYSSMQNDLNTPQTLAVLLKTVKYAKANLHNLNKKEFLDFLDFMSLLFGVSFQPEKIKVPQEIIELGEKRLIAKQEQDYDLADNLRNKINKQWYNILDIKDGFKLILQ